MQNFNPTVSRDGARAAFTAFGGAQAARIEVRVKDLRTGGETAVPVQAVNMGQVPRLSPDGSLLAYRDVVEGRSKTFVVAPGGTAARALCENCFVTGFFPGNEAALVRSKAQRAGEDGPSDRGEKRSSVVPRGTSSRTPACRPTGGGSPGSPASRTGGPRSAYLPSISLRTGRRETITVAEADIISARPTGPPTAAGSIICPRRTAAARSSRGSSIPGRRSPSAEEREILETTGSRLWLNYPYGNGAIAVAADRIVFEAASMSGNIYLARPKKR